MSKPEFSLLPVEQSDETTQIEGQHYRNEDIYTYGTQLWEHHIASLPILQGLMAKIHRRGLAGQIIETYMEIGFFHGMLQGDSMARATATMAITENQRILGKMINSSKETVVT